MHKIKNASGDGPKILQKFEKKRIKRRKSKKIIDNKFQKLKKNKEVTNDFKHTWQKVPLTS